MRADEIDGWTVGRDGPWWVADRDGEALRAATLAKLRQMIRDRK